jgi:hypothetical protein
LENLVTHEAGDELGLKIFRVHFAL